MADDTRGEVAISYLEKALHINPDLCSAVIGQVTEKHDFEGDQIVETKVFGSGYLWVAYKDRSDYDTAKICIQRCLELGYPKSDANYFIRRYLYVKIKVYGFLKWFWLKELKRVF